MDEDLNDLKKKPMTKKQLYVGVATAVAFFGYLTVATVFADQPIVRMLMIGPYGASAGAWFIIVVGILVWLSSREQRAINR